MLKTSRRESWTLRLQIDLTVLFWVINIKFALPNVKKLNFSLVINGENLNVADLNVTESTMFSGLTIDSKLHWNYQSPLHSSAALGVKKIRQMTDIGTARLVYFSYFRSILQNATMG